VSEVDIAPASGDRDRRQQVDDRFSYALPRFAYRRSEGKCSAEPGHVKRHWGFLSWEIIFLFGTFLVLKILYQLTYVPTTNPGEHTLVEGTNKGEWSIND
jgi:hypothetical protein